MGGVGQGEVVREDDSLAIEEDCATFSQKRLACDYDSYRAKADMPER